MDAQCAILHDRLVALCDEICLFADCFLVVFRLLLLGNDSLLTAHCHCSASLFADCEIKFSLCSNPDVV